MGGTTSLVFEASPLDLSAVVDVVPLGNLNPPGHTLPTDHIYINNRAAAGPPVAPATIYAPASGTVQFIIRNGVEAKVGVRAGSFMYYLDHVVLDASVAQGASLTSGQRIGTTGTLTYGIDLGVINYNRTNFFAAPSRYADESLHGDKPLTYFEEPLRSQLYSRVSRLGTDRDGQFDFDQTGHLVGNWFFEGLPPGESADSSAWSQHLAFVYDNYDPQAIRISIGGTLPIVGAFAVQAGAPDPKDITPSSGAVTYQLLRPGFQGGAPGD